MKNNINYPTGKVIVTEKKTLKNILYYLQGNIRYKLYYSKFAFLIRRRILEQINVRVESMKKECYDTGNCVKCGCTTIELQMCNKACKGFCYPKMLTSIEWNKLKNNKLIASDGYFWQLKNNTFKKYE